MSNSSYKQILKATSLFGGVQVFQILIQIVRSKLIAVLLGPSGMGIVGLLNGTLDMVRRFTNFGLGTSAVKDVAEAYSCNDIVRVSTTVNVVRRWVWVTGLLGTVLVIVLSPWLSRFTFGNQDYTFAFIWISITLLLSQLSVGQLVILQGMRRLKYLASANVLGSFIGLFLSIPLYYYFNLKGIVPAIIGTSLITVLVSYYFSSKIKFTKINLSFNDSFYKGLDMAKMGFMLSLSGLLSTACAYLIRIFIGKQGGVEEVGLFVAGFSIINSYVGMIFSAMGTDYYPRLAATAIDNSKTSKLINQQAEIALLIISPIIIVFLVYSNFLINLLYSSKFEPISVMVLWAALGMIFKSISWAIGYLFLAKGDSKLFFISELLANVYILGLNIFGYYYYGLEGLGVSFLIGYILYLLQVYLFARNKYEFELNRPLIKVFLIQTCIASVCLILMKTLLAPQTYLVGVPFIIASFWYSYKELDNRIGLKQWIVKLKTRNEQ